MSENSFDDLNLKDNLLRGIYSYGFESPSPIQVKSIPIINNKKDLIAQAQSGTGKTASFVIGALNNLDESLKKTQVLILNPTHELANQNFNVLENFSNYMDITMMKVIGKTSVRECISELNKEPQVIVGTPGRVLDMIEKKVLFTENIKLFIFDEADEMLSYGFLDMIYKITSFIPKQSQICLFSATMPDEIVELTDKFLMEPEKILVDKDKLSLEGITQFYINSFNDESKYDILLDIYNTFNLSQCIIYVNYKNKLLNIYDKLLSDKYPVCCIYGDMDSRERKSILDDFKAGKHRILLTTDLLSRGIDIQQLSLVINYDLPKSKETYIHRIGRSGRYGRKGLSINFVSNREMYLMEELQEFYKIKIDEMPQNLNDYLN